MPRRKLSLALVLRVIRPSKESIVLHVIGWPESANGTPKKGTIASARKEWLYSLEQHYPFVPVFDVRGLSC